MAVNTKCKKKQAKKYISICDVYHLPHGTQKKTSHEAPRPNKTNVFFSDVL